MKINPMNTMSFQAKIRPNNKPTTHSPTNEELASMITGSGSGLLGSSFMIGDGQFANETLKNITPEAAEATVKNNASVALTPLVLGIYFLNMARNQIINRPQDPSEPETLTKDDINIDEGK